MTTTPPHRLLALGPAPALVAGLALLLVLLLGACGGDGTAVPPSPVDGPTPFRYPVSLWDSGVQGETELLVRVAQDGRVDSVLVSRSSGRAAFDSAAVAGAPGLRFLPGHRGGHTLPMWVKVPVRFSRDTAAADTAG
jgi:TonB family protein